MLGLLRRDGLPEAWYSHLDMLAYRGRLSLRWFTLRVLVCLACHPLNRLRQRKRLDHLAPEVPTLFRVLACKVAQLLITSNQWLLIKPAVDSLPGSARYGGGTFLFHQLVVSPPHGGADLEGFQKRVVQQ